MSSGLKSTLFTGIGIFFAAALSHGQVATTALSGTVYDSTRAVVASAKVTAVNDATGVSMAQATNSAGLFSFPSVGVGTYTLTIEMSGF
jgi:hypothetical protein